MTLPRLLPFLFVVFTTVGYADPASVPAPGPLVEKAVAAAGGQGKLLKLFRMKEKFHFGDAPEPPEGKKPSTRESILEAPDYWWVGKKDRTGEPAKFDVWAWTLGAVVDPRTKIETVPDIQEEGKPAPGIRLSGTVTPAMELYFDPASALLLRMDWRGDIYRFSEWKDHDGTKYPSKCVIFKKSTGKPWFFHEITELERLKDLPEGIIRTPVQK